MTDEPLRYIYLDDEAPAVVRPYIHEVQDNTPGLLIEPHSPRPYGRQVEWLHEQQYDGLILDLRLDVNQNWESPEEGKADYRAAGLAQELRTRAADPQGKYLDTPIVLWSTNEKLDRMYRRDDFSHDLYDRKTVKNSLLAPGAGARVGRELLALARGYQQILEIKRELGYRLTPFHRLLGFDEEPAALDPRIASHFSGRGSLPVHVVARFILQQLLEHEGPLIDHDVLLARLGLSRDAPEGLDLVLGLFEGAEYRGPFAGGWARWWGADVAARWATLAEGERPLRQLSAEERVAVLRDITGCAALQAATPLPGATSTRYWTVCRATLRPIDPRDGFTLVRRDDAPWLADRLVSGHAIKQRLLDEHMLVLSPLESTRATLALQV